MDWSTKLDPVLHSFKTLPSMINELMHVPVHLRRQEEDWRKLLLKYPELNSYFNERDGIQEMLRPAYLDYNTRYSSSLISLSLNRAAFLFFLTKLLNAKTIHDLGSGFSSYVFRHASNAHERQVISVDDSAFWLKRTVEFLQRYQTNTDHIISLDDYLKEYADKGFDLCLLDIGDFQLRQRLLPGLANSLQKHGGMLFVDDFHVPLYRNCIRRLCAERGLQIFSLRKVTRRRLSHAALIME